MESKNELIHFTLNVIRFENKYYNSIIEGIKIKYKEIYPNDILKVEYEKISNEFIFLVFKSLNVICKSGIKSKYVLLEKYKNIDAVELFSNIPMKDYLEKYDESKYNYLDKLKNYIDSLQVCYKLIDMDFYEVSISQSGYRIRVKKKFKSSFPHKSISRTFKFDIVTKEEYLKSEKHIKTELENIYDLNKK